MRKNPTIHNGFTISAIAEQLPDGCWQGQVTLNKAGFEALCVPGRQKRPSEQLATQCALELGRNLVNYKIEGLRRIGQ